MNTRCQKKETIQTMRYLIRPHNNMHNTFINFHPGTRNCQYNLLKQKKIQKNPILYPI